LWHFLIDALRFHNTAFEIRERKRHVLLFAFGSECATSFSLSAANVPGSESSLYGTFALGSESTWERKFQSYDFAVRNNAL